MSRIQRCQAKSRYGAASINPDIGKSQHQRLCQDSEGSDRMPRRQDARSAPQRAICRPMNWPRAIRRTLSGSHLRFWRVYDVRTLVIGTALYFSGMPATKIAGHLSGTHRPCRAEQMRAQQLRSVLAQKLATVFRPKTITLVF